MKWFERAEILDYIIECYAGTDGPKRQFIWEQPNGDVVIGNTRAFGDHVAERFGLSARDTRWMSIHEALRALGEVVQVHSPKTKHLGKRFRNQIPEIRILKRKD